MSEIENNILDKVSSPKANATINASSPNGHVKVEVWYKDDIKLKTTASVESETLLSLGDVISISSTELENNDEGITDYISTARKIGFIILHRNIVRQHMDTMGEKIEKLRQKSNK
ncbi:MAG: hypothetical protein WCK26_01360 [Candidatus Saccharibacteria bacterium]